MGDLEIDQKVLFFDYEQINSYTDFVNPQVEIYSLMEGVNKKVETSSHLFFTGKKNYYMGLCFTVLSYFSLKHFFYFSYSPYMAKRVMEENFNPSYRARHRG